MRLHHLTQLRKEALERSAQYYYTPSSWNRIYIYKLLFLEVTRNWLFSVIFSITVPHVKSELSKVDVIQIQTVSQNNMIVCYYERCIYFQGSPKLTSKRKSLYGRKLRPQSVIGNRSSLTPRILTPWLEHLDTYKGSPGPNRSQQP